MSLDSFVVEAEAVDDSFSRFGDFQLVGHGEVTNKSCGTYRGLKGCLNVEKHGFNLLDGKDYHGKVVVKVVHWWCHRASCPVCYSHGWATREADKMEQRLAEGSKRFGQVEHIVASPPPRDYSLSFEALRGRVVKRLEARGILGGSLIFHGARYNKTKRWYWSPHFHVLGFVLGGYGQCRHCKKGSCIGCSGFEARTRREFDKDGYIVKVLEERKKAFGRDKPNVFGTAHYELNHATVKVNVKRFHVVTWFGVCSYRKLKVTVQKRKDLCLLCGEEFGFVRDLSSRVIVTDRGAVGFKHCIVDDYYDENGVVKWSKE